MATLDWVGKDAVVNHHRKVPYHLLRCDGKLSAGDADAGNLLVQGDNLLALKAMLPYYAGKVKCIYIDPPYNTGKEGWVFNDRVNSPEIQQWLGQVVGPEAEDLCRHDKWLCMMYPRLALLKEFLLPDGVIFISVGTDEIGNLRTLCDSLFGRANLLEIFIWQIEGNVENQEAITATHDYVLAYERQAGRSNINATVDPNVEEGSKLLRDFAENSVVKNGPGNPASVIKLPVGFPCAVPELRLSKHDFAEQFKAEVEAGDGYIKREMRAAYGASYPIRLDDIVADEGQLAAPCRVYSGWSSARKLRRFIDLECSPLDEQDGSTLIFFLSHTGVPTYRRENRSAHFVPTILRNMGTTEKRSNELERMGVRFSYPKPVGLIKHLIGLYAKPGDLVLDSFCGSGTTGQAVLELATGQVPDLRFLLVEMEKDIARNVAAKSLSCVCQGYEWRQGSRQMSKTGLGRGFRYCKLGNPLFDKAGDIAEEVRFADLAAHVFFTETGSPIPKRASGRNPLLGVHQGKAVYLLFNGVLGDKRPRGGNVLTHSVAQDLPAHPAGRGPRVVYGEACRLGPKSPHHYGITFRQIPYELKVD